MKISEFLKLLVRVFFTIYTGSMFGATFFLTVFAVPKVDTALLWHIILISVVATLFSFIFYSHKEVSKKSLLFRNTIHFLLIFGLLTGSAYCFHWFSFANSNFVLFFIIQFILIYSLVTLITHTINHSQAKRLNQKLAEYQKRRGEKLE
jgi:hypothetical protein